MLETLFIKNSKRILLFKWRVFSVFIIIFLDAFIFVINRIAPDLFNCLSFLEGSSPIGWAITILGFTITARNFLFTRRNDIYLNISMKDILEGNVKCLDKFLWYIILLMPLNMLLLYLQHSQKCLWFFVIISLISMLMYFHDVLTRMNNQECLKEISNIIQLYLIQDKENDFSNIIIEKVSSSNYSIELLSIEKRVNDGLYKKLIKKTHTKCILSSFTEYYTYKYLKYPNFYSFILNIIKKVNYGLYKKLIIKPRYKCILSSFFEYFNYKLLKSPNFVNNILNNIPEFSFFITKNISKISLHDFVFCNWINNKYEDFYEMLRKVEETNSKQEFELIEKFILKYLFGIYLAAFINFDLSYNEKIYKDFLGEKWFDDYPLLRQKIKAVILLVINYSILNQLSECNYFESDFVAIFNLFSDNITAIDIADLKNDVFNSNELIVERFVKHNYNICGVLNLMEKQIENEFSIRLLYGTKYMN